jgi:CBS domain-containing protein
MKCEDIMSTNLEWLSEQDTVQTAAQRMAEAGVGFLPICDAGKRVVGVITDRDLVTRGMAKGVVPATTSVALIMTSPVLTCPQTTDLREAEELMATAQKSRLVITNAEARLAGVLSLADLLENAPTARALQTARAVLWREALGPRGGSLPGQPLLKDDPNIRSLPPPSDELEVRASVFKGGHHTTDTKEFPT